MARTLLCEIVTPERIVYTNEVNMVIAPTIDGEIGILPLHVPLVSVLRAGEIRVRYDETETEWFAVSGGYIQVHEDKVIILADQATAASQIDVERARTAKELLEARMKEISDESEKALVERELQWSDVQLRIAGKRS